MIVVSDAGLIEKKQGIEFLQHNRIKTREDC
jgi:hypothetical protein